MAFCLLGVLAILYSPIIMAGPSVEMDFVWISVGNVGASWFSYMDQIEGLFQKPIMHAIGNAKPGSWIFHLGMGGFFEDRARVRLLAILFLLLLDALLVGVLAHLLYQNRAITAASATIFALHPQLSGITAMVSSGGPLLALFWLLIAFISLLRFKRHKRLFHLIPMASAVFLCHATHNIGLVIVPAMFFLDIATTEGKWTPGKITGLIGRQFLVFLSFISFSLIWLPTGGISEMVRVVVALKLIRPVLLALNDGLIRLILPSSSVFDIRHGFGVLDLGQIFLFSMPVLLGLAIAAIFKNVNRLFPLMLIFLGILFQAPNMLTIGDQTPAYSICYLVSAIGFALLMGDLFMRIPPKAVGYLAVFSFLCACLASDHINSTHWAKQGNHVRQMADQLETIYLDLGDSPDIFIIGAGKFTEPMLAAHLDFVRRYGIIKPTRFSFVDNGKVLPAGKEGPLGESPRGIVRLFLDDSMTFLGYGRQGNLVNLTDLIRSKVKEAKEILMIERKLVPSWRLGTENMIRNWSAKADADNLIPVDDSSNIAWYIEGQILNLHPLAGRHLF